MNEHILLDLRKVRSDCKYPVCIYLKGKDSIRVKTGYFSLKSHFSRGLFNQKEDNYIEKNNALKAILSQCTLELSRLVATKENKDWDDNKLKNHLLSLINNNEESSSLFLRRYKPYAMLKKKEGTRRVYMETYKKVEMFDNKCTIDTMNFEWFERFTDWMANSGLMVNSYNIHLRNIRAFFNYAVKCKITQNYPFREISIKAEETRKRNLTVEQLRIIMNMAVEPYQERYRDVFVLGIYLIGINLGDLLLLKNNDFNGDRIEYKRLKTNKLYSIKVEPEALRIIEKYRGFEHLLCFMDDMTDYRSFLKQMNKALKKLYVIEKKSRISKPKKKYIFPSLSYYWCQHTWASLAYEVDIPVDTIARGLGHYTGNSVTFTYINFNYKKVDIANRKVIDYILDK